MIVLYIVVGICAGVLGGMGMGGGTILIPMLTIFFKVNQHVAQAINLISFIPMAIVAVILHVKNRLIDFKGLGIIISSGILMSLLGSMLAKNVEGEKLSKIFGGFLIVLAVLQLIFSQRRAGKNK